MKGLTLKAPAKINLFLEILNQREDGYHNISTLMQRISLHDTLTFLKINEGVIIKTDNIQLPSDRRNLVHQAARLILSEGKVAQGVKIFLRKKIPISSGLGGGSSDAASTLLGVNRLYDLNYSLKRLHLLAEKLGSDVPFFLYGQTALAEGRGEKIKPVKVYKDYWIVLVTFPFQVSTAWAYQDVKINLTRRAEYIKIKNLQEKEGFFEALNAWRNDFEGKITEKYPQVRYALKLLSKQGAIKSSMTGSGPTVYGVFEQEPNNEEVKRLFKREDWQIFITRPIP
ncbi:MAG: 4-(cytidine 5'-diphospho)-2-C-methyl-D-erythritol kinase [candidate division Zixibacteria bacterium RBG_16_43_9]|nr:MAG: 4-(cytidine 5'-diphospho)-2-C-methyl-D-erythritol kinase [candidate division Zixibacteria bacterium RBG_16_43_9]